MFDKFMYLPIYSQDDTHTKNNNKINTTNETWKENQSAENNVIMAVFAGAEIPVYRKPYL